MADDLYRGGAVTWEQLAAVLTPVAVIVGHLLNARAIKKNTQLTEVVHKATNGMSERNEAIARKLGVEEGKATEKANPS